jgi:hypothetical protein
MSLWNLETRIKAAGNMNPRDKPVQAHASVGTVGVAAE